MSKFEKEALDYFKNIVGPGMLQRIDGIECFSTLPNFWFWKFRLNRMVRKGLLIKRKTSSFLPTYDGMMSYGITWRKNNG